MIEKFKKRKDFLLINKKLKNFFPKKLIKDSLEPKEAEMRSSHSLGAEAKTFLEALERLFDN